MQWRDVLISKARSHVASLGVFLMQMSIQHSYSTVYAIYTHIYPWEVLAIGAGSAPSGYHQFRTSAKIAPRSASFLLCGLNNSCRRRRRRRRRFKFRQFMYRGRAIVYRIVCDDSASSPVR